MFEWMPTISGRYQNKARFLIRGKFSHDRPETADDVEIVSEGDAFTLESVYW